MNNFLKNNKYYLLSAALIYLLILIPSLYTPFQSDDYSYFLQGIDLKGRWAHYMNWSGRLITDFTSSALLTLFPRWLYQAINAFVFLLLVIFISLVPVVLSRKEKKTKASAIVLWIVFFIYWIANPRLGETSFWLVGSANYLWPIMWASAYIIYLLTLIKKEQLKFKDYIFIIVLGFLAGCSNENTSISIVLFSVIVLLLENNKKIISLGFISSLLGTLVLILAPGNYERKKWFGDWYNQSTVKQLYIHIFERMPNTIVDYLHVYLLLIVFLLLALYLLNKFNKKSALYGLIFFLLSIFANIILAKSPYIGGRNLNTGLFFMLPTLAIVTYELVSIWQRKLLIPMTLIIAYSLLFFIPSYLLFTNMMYQTYHQHQFREHLIESEKSKGKVNIVLPDWYFPKVLKSSDIFDTFKSGSTPYYYGVDSIDWSHINFNYAALEKGTAHSINQALIDNLSLISIYEYQEYPMSKKALFVFEFNDDLQKFIKDGETALYIHLITTNDEFINVDQPINAGIKIGDNYYYGTQKVKVSLDQIKQINFGFYDPVNHTNSQNFSINL